MVKEVRRNGGRGVAVVLGPDDPKREREKKMKIKKEDGKMKIQNRVVSAEEGGNKEGDNED